MQYHPHTNSQGVSVYITLEILKTILLYLYIMGEKLANSYLLKSDHFDEQVVLAKVTWNVTF